MRRQQKQDDTAVALAFAKAMPVGTRCRYYPVLPAGEDEWQESVVRSEPWLLGHGAAVVMIECRSGGVSIHHVFPVGIELTT